MAESAIQAKASTLWVEMWRLGGEKWPPESIPAAWRMYQHLKEALVAMGVREAQAIAFADDFFYSQSGWGDLTFVDNHKRPIETLTATLVDAELSSENT